MDYNSYLQSEAWRIQRLKAIKKADNRCMLCNRKFDEHLKCVVHHRTYQYPYGSPEELENLVCLCEECHLTFHSFFSYSSRTKSFYLGGDKRIGRPVEGKGSKVSMPKKPKKKKAQKMRDRVWVFPTVLVPITQKEFLERIDKYYSKDTRKGYPRINKLFNAKRDFIQKYNKYHGLIVSGIKPDVHSMGMSSKQVGCITWYYRRRIFNKKSKPSSAPQ